MSKLNNSKYLISEKWSWADPDACEKNIFSCKHLWRLKMFFWISLLTGECLYGGKTGLEALSVFNKDWKTINVSQLNYRLDGLRCDVL